MTLFRDWLHITTLSALANNIAVSQLHLLLYKIALSNLRPSTRQVNLDVNATRQWLQIILTTTTLLLWPLYDTSDWSWRLNVIVPCVVAVRLCYKGYIIASSDDIEVQLVSRSSSPSELLYGPLQVAFILVWLGLYAFGTRQAAIIGAAVGIGDALAPLIGSRFGRHYYQVPLAARKTMEGSLCGVFLGTICGGYLFMYAFGLPVLPLRMVLLYGSMAAILEGTAFKGMDNVVMAVAMHLAMDRLQEWLPA